MSSAAHWRSVLWEVDRASLCSNPVRLRGITLDRSTGELVEGSLLVACKDRRASVCPSCSRLYQADAWQLVAAGIRGGKGVDAGVVDHPQLFVTLTAPSFGPVHSGPSSAGVSRVCRPRREGTCPHGLPLSCRRRHDADAIVLGDPLCAECFDYRGAVLWNAHVARLWERTSLRLYRLVARFGGVSTSQLRASARLSYIKVVEFQHRGLVHLHVVLRSDGSAGPSEPPPSWLDADVLEAAVRGAVSSAHVSVPSVAGGTPSRARWGTQIDVRRLEPGDSADAIAIAAYVAKYATKTADGSPWLAHRIRSAAEIEHLELRPHIVRLVRTAWTLGGRREVADLGLRAHAHALGYGGQFSSKSVRYSTTFKALRAARVLYARGEAEDPFDFDGEWRFAGRGYAHAEADLLARRLYEAARGVPNRVLRMFVPRSVPIAMTWENDPEKNPDRNTLRNCLSNCLRNPVWRDGVMTNPRSSRASVNRPRSFSPDAR